MRNQCCAACVLLTLHLLAMRAIAAEPIPLWPDKAPGENNDLGNEKRIEPKAEATKQVLRLTDVSQPTITIYPPTEENRTQAAVVVCPGGGYSILAWDIEGQEVVAWLNRIGVTGVLLKYRVPRRSDRPKHEAPLQDAQRAIRIVRHRAESLAIDPNRIGIMGFSAGGHLSAATSTNSEKPAYQPLDPQDETSCRPDFAMLIYPAYLVDDYDAEHPKIAPELTITNKTPPTILIGTADDRHVRGAPYYYVALQRAKVPVEMHIYPRGGHGYGLRPSKHRVCTWPERCADWMEKLGVLDPG